MPNLRPVIPAKNHTANIPWQVSNAKSHGEKSTSQILGSSIDKEKLEENAVMPESQGWFGSSQGQMSANGLDLVI